MTSNIHVTIGTAKMENIQSINLPFNDYCHKMRSKDHVTKNNKTYDIVCKKCYSFTHVKRTDHGPKSLRAYMDLNSILFNQLISLYPNIPAYLLPTIGTKFGRFLSHGELSSYEDLKMFCAIANAPQNEDVNFAIWTKRANFIAQAKHDNIIPPNMICVFSNPLIDHPVNTVPKHFDKIFNVLTADYAFENDIIPNCGTKQCYICQNCYKHNNTNVIYELQKNQTKKYERLTGIQLKRT